MQLKTTTQVSLTNSLRYLRLQIEIINLVLIIFFFNYYYYCVDTTHKWATKGLGRENGQSTSAILKGSTLQ